jgi:hypothetical protein
MNCYESTYQLAVEKLCKVSETMLYHTVIEHTVPLLNDEVNKLIAKGWRPLGGVSISGWRRPFGDMGFYCAQAMTLHSDDFVFRTGNSAAATPAVS